MKKIRIAQIGTNRYSHGPDIFLTLKALPEIFDIAGYALAEDERETCKEKLSVFSGYPELSVDEILNDPAVDAVAVETDEIHLTKYALLAAEHGKHIHMEKPGSPSLPDYEALIRTVKQRGTVLHLGYMYRYHPYLADAVHAAASGSLGRIFSVEAQMSRYDNAETRTWLSAFPGGMMFYLGCHLVDLVLRTCGLPAEVIPLNQQTEPDTVPGFDHGMAVLRYPEALCFVKTCGAELGGGARRQFVVNGTKGSVEIRPLESFTGNGFALRSHRIVTDASGNASEETSAVFDRYKPMLTAFASMVSGEQENPYTPDYELQLFKTLLRCCGM